MVQGMRLNSELVSDRSWFEKKLGPQTTSKLLARHNVYNRRHTPPGLAERLQKQDFVNTKRTNSALKVACFFTAWVTVTVGNEFVSPTYSSFKDVVSSSPFTERPVTQWSLSVPFNQKPGHCIDATQSRWAPYVFSQNVTENFYGNRSNVLPPFPRIYHTIVHGNTSTQPPSQEPFQRHSINYVSLLPIQY
jgi:hypothetical protein